MTLLWVIIACCCGAAAAALAPEGLKGGGFLLGLVFGPFGILISVILNIQEKGKNVDE